ncbi:MAG TPA: glycine-rich protein [Kofleriaceae bacterium]|nr:glycine-rich protein [Kofleriaceae bacterium]
MRLALISLLFAAACGNVSTTRCESAAVEDCNGDPADGCEADLGAAASCGSCGNVCEAPVGGTATCTAGTCGFDCGAGLMACGDACVARCGTVLDVPGTQPYSVPDRCTRLRVKAWGAGGGNGQGNMNAAGGGFAVVEFAVTPGESLMVVIGGPGRSAQGGQPGAGGTPGGGGNGGSGGDQDGGGGGGFSGVFAGGVEVATAIAIAGGGGGSGGGTSNNLPGAGGGANGQSGGGLGGTQIDGSATLAGGAGVNQTDGGGGGGGGWFGGRGGPGASSDAGGGGGGSAYATTRATFQLLVAGDRRTPGSSTDPDRGMAGEPGMPGKVVIDCVP